jgi:hypothetical protein
VRERVRSEYLDGPRQACYQKWPTRAVSLSVQTFLLETRKLDLQETPLNLGLGAVREYREGSVSRAEIRRRNHVGTHRSSFNHLLVAWAFRISRIHRFIPRIAGCWHRPPDYAFRVWAKGQRIRNGDRTQKSR